MAQFCHKIVFSSFLSPHTNNKHNNNKEQENHFCLDMLVSNSYLAPIPTFSGSSTTLSMAFQISKCYLLRLCVFPHSSAIFTKYYSSTEVNGWWCTMYSTYWLLYTVYISCLKWIETLCIIQNNTKTMRKQWLNKWKCNAKATEILSRKLKLEKKREDLSAEWLSAPKDWL